MIDLELVSLQGEEEDIGFVYLKSVLGFAGGGAQVAMLSSTTAAASLRDK